MPTLHSTMLEVLRPHFPGYTDEGILRNVLVHYIRDANVVNPGIPTLSKDGKQILKGCDRGNPYGMFVLVRLPKTEHDSTPRILVGYSASRDTLLTKKKYPVYSAYESPKDAIVIGYDRVAIFGKRSYPVMKFNKSVGFKIATNKMFSGIGSYKIMSDYEQIYREAVLPRALRFFGKDTENLTERSFIPCWSGNFNSEF